MVTTTAADIMINTIMDWGVDVVFGLPGDGINGIMEALRIRQEKIRFIQVRHEESAAFMACAHAKYTGRLGVCLATSGPAAIRTNAQTPIECRLSPDSRTKGYTFPFLDIYTPGSARGRPSLQISCLCQYSTWANDAPSYS